MSKVYMLGPIQNPVGANIVTRITLVLKKIEIIPFEAPCLRSRDQLVPQRLSEAPKLRLYNFNIDLYCIIP